MLTCLASESTFPTFVTFPPQVLSMGERGAWLWFPCTRPVRQRLLLPVLPPLLQPLGIPSALAQLGITHIPLVPCSATSLGGVTRCGSRDQGWLTLMRLPPSYPSHSVPGALKNIKQHKNEGKISIIGQSVALSYFKGPEVRLAGPLECWWLQCQHR